MELTVEVDGTNRTVSGLTETTTCAQVIYALAHATSQKGRFVLVERFRNAERRLSPDDRPLEMLSKWKEHAKNVSFILRKVEDREHNPQSEQVAPTINASSLPIVDNHSATLQSQRLVSSTSVQSAVVYSTIQRNKPEMAASSSSASLPAYNLNNSNSTGTLRNRRPPPDYASVMEKRFNSLSRDVRTRPALDPSRFGVHGDASISSMNLSPADLMALIEKQRVTIERQRERLFDMEMQMPHEEERELLQLEKQMENLRVVLQPIRDANWPQQYNKEYTTALRMKIAVESTKDALQKIKREVDERNREEDELNKQLFELMSLEDNSSIGVSQVNGQNAVQMQAC